MRRLEILVVMLLTVLGAGFAGPGVSHLGAAEPRVVLKHSRRPHYAGEPVVVQVTAEGFEETPTPKCTPGEISGGTLTPLGVSSPQVSTFTRIYNGRVHREKRVTYNFQFTFVANAPRRYRIEPFTVSQGSVELTTRALVLNLETIPTSDDIRVRIDLPDTPVYVGQRLPVTLEWWFHGDTDDIGRSSGLGVRRLSRRDLSSYEIYLRAPLFMLSDAFDFIDADIESDDIVLPLQTDGEPVPVRATLERRKHDGREYLVFSAKRTVVPLRAGDYDLEPASASVTLVTRWVRDFFERRAAETKRARAEGLPRRLVVREPPVEGRPESYAGAIGDGFSIKVAADRTVLRVGDPVTLELEVRGDGNLATAGLPDLSADGGLSPVAFRLPEGDVAGIYDAERSTKTFEVSVKVLSEAVSEIPPIAYSWFDVEQERYFTTRSKPIALSVSRAQVVSARDVVGVAPAASDPSSPAPSRATEAPSPTSLGFRLQDADLSLETRPEIALRPRGRILGSVPAQAGLYGTSLLLVALAVMGRRRALRDPRLREQKKLLVEARRQITGAASQPRAKGTADIASRLRELLAAIPAARDPALDEFLGECDAIIYAPAPDEAAKVDDELFRRALEWLEQIEGRAS